MSPFRCHQRLRFWGFRGWVLSLKKVKDIACEPKQRQTHSTAWLFSNRSAAHGLSGAAAAVWYGIHSNAHAHRYMVSMGLRLRFLRASSAACRRASAGTTACAAGQGVGGGRGNCKGSCRTRADATARRCCTTSNNPANSACPPPHPTPSLTQISPAVCHCGARPAKGGALDRGQPGGQVPPLLLLRFNVVLGTRRQRRLGLLVLRWLPLDLELRQDRGGGWTQWAAQPPAQNCC